MSFIKHPIISNSLSTECVHSMSDISFFFLPVLSSMQAEGTGAGERRAWECVEKAPTGLHRCSATDFTCNIQREQAPIQRVTNHYLSAAGTGAGHRQQLFHERTAAEPR